LSYLIGKKVDTWISLSCRFVDFLYIMIRLVGGLCGLVMCLRGSFRWPSLIFPFGVKWTFLNITLDYTYVLWLKNMIWMNL
jgi:hypothetical protein